MSKKVNKKAKKDTDFYEHIKSEYFYELEKTNKIDNKISIALTVYGLVIAYNGLTFKYQDLFFNGMLKSDIILAIIMLVMGLFVIISSLVLIFNLIKALKSTGYKRVSPSFLEKKLDNSTDVKLCTGIIKCYKENQDITELRLKNLNKSLTWLPFIFIITVILSVLFEIIRN